MNQSKFHTCKSSLRKQKLWFLIASYILNKWSRNGLFKQQQYMVYICQKVIKNGNQTQLLNADICNDSGVQCMQFKEMWPERRLLVHFWWRICPWHFKSGEQGPDPEVRLHCATESAVYSYMFISSGAFRSLDRFVQLTVNSSRKLRTVVLGDYLVLGLIFFCLYRMVYSTSNDLSYVSSIGVISIPLMS